MYALVTFVPAVTNATGAFPDAWKQPVDDSFLFAKWFRGVEKSYGINSYDSCYAFCANGAFETCDAFVFTPNGCGTRAKDVNCWVFSHLTNDFSIYGVKPNMQDAADGDPSSYVSPGGCNCKITPQDVCLVYRAHHENIENSVKAIASATLSFTLFSFIFLCFIGGAIGQQSRQASEHESIRRRVNELESSQRVTRTMGTISAGSTRRTSTINIK